MPNLNLAHLVFLLDRSGSMETIKSDIEGGFAAFIDEQTAADGECVVTLAQFDTHFEVVYAGMPVLEVPPLDLQPRGGTALLDAMGRLITDTRTEIASQPEEQRPGTVIIAIMTDGHENSSREWSYPAIKSLVEQQTASQDWQFMYMGADQDAIEVGASLGVSRAHSVTYGKGKSRSAMAAASANIRDYRREKMLNLEAAMPVFSDVQRAELAED
ncbi:vWA domain-containing protein [Smaragdicoccus niigatensis]|uniref:vWA domain-containing protein n=1 Tax=Smaragdicoccus niigatensis TaxID=359359 RepID=UPI000360B105|nr:vWA domain-containing protein [Smaragdicoccus niigatensis]